MSTEKQTFGSFLSEARKKLNMSQKDLATRILREDGEPISPQYLNDIEKDRRNPSSDHMIQQFAAALNLDKDYLHYLVGNLPDDIRRRNLNQEQVSQAFRAFRGGPPPKGR